MTIRRLLLACLVLISVQSFGQNPTNYLLRNTRERLISSMVDSMFRIPRYNGTPSGVRVNESSTIDGAIAMDTTNHLLYMFSGNTWVRIAKYSELGGGGGIGAATDSIANVRNYGAVGDGSTEDSAAFKNAIASGLPVFVPKGTYKITATLLLNSKQMIFGTGGTSIIYNSGSKAAIKTQDSCTVQGLSFRGTGYTTSFPSINDQAQQMGVWINGYNNRIEGCTFFKLNGRGVWIYSPTITNMEGNIVSNNIADSNTVAFCASFGSNYGIFSNNSARYNYGGYYEEGAANMTNDGNIYQGNTYAMYFAAGDLRGSIVNCQLNHSNVTFTQGNIYGMLISDCSFFNTNLNIGTVDTVKFLNFNNCRFVGCTITSTKADSCQFLGGRFMQTVTVSGSGVKFHNVIGTASNVNEWWGGIGLSDSSLNVRNGLRVYGGINAPNLPAFADTTSWKPVVINSSGTMRKATYWPVGSGGGGSPAGNFGNLQINRNGAFAAPASDSLDWESSTGLTVTGGLRSTSLGVGVAAPTSSYMASIKSNSTVSGVLKLTSDQTSLNYLEFHNDGYGTVGYFNSIFNGAQYVIQSSSGEFRLAQGANLIQTWNLNDGTKYSRRMQTKQGASVASANNMTLGNDGNVFEITGTTQINLINNTNWQDGSEITLLFTSTPTVKNGQTTSSTNITIKLAGGADFSATADDALKLVLSTVGGVQAWREVSRSVN